MLTLLLVALILAGGLGCLVCIGLMAFYMVKKRRRAALWTACFAALCLATAVVGGA